MHSGKRSIAALALAGALGLAACGDDDEDAATPLSKGAYTSRLAALGKQQDAAHADVEKAFKAKSVAQIKTYLDAFGDSQERLGDQVDAIEPPADARAANARLAAGAHELARQIHAAADGLDPGASTAAALKATDAKLGRASGAAKLDSALSTLNRLGYTESG